MEDKHTSGRKLFDNNAYLIVTIVILIVMVYLSMLDII